MRNNKIKELELDIAELKYKNRKLSDVVDFLIKNEKTDIVIERVPLINCGTFCGFKTVIKYLSNCKVYELDSPFMEFKVDVIDNNLDSAILKQGETYYQLDKVKERIIKIPKPAFVLEKELAEKKETEKKSSK